MKKIETRHGMMTVPERMDLPSSRHAYLKDAVDLAAYELYAQSGFHPPERPEGFLDEGEAAVWERWRQRAQKEKFE